MGAGRCNSFGRSPSRRREWLLPPWLFTVTLKTAGVPDGPLFKVPTDTQTVTAVWSFAKSASTQMGGSPARSVGGLPACSTQLFTSHWIGAPPLSYFRKNSRLTFGKLLSSDDTRVFLARCMVAFSVLSEDCGFARRQLASNRKQKLGIIHRIYILDTAACAPVAP